MSSPKRKKSSVKKSARAPKTSVALLVGTRKGAFIIKSDPARRTWKVSEPYFLGNLVHHFVLDPRDGRTLLAAAKTGHLGPTIFRSTDFGKTWKEAARPPAFRKANENEKPRVVDHVFWLTSGHASEPNVWYAGTSPQGLFRSEDGGITWDGIDGFNENPRYWEIVGGEQDGTPDGPKTHSIIVDPRDAQHLYVGLSSGGVRESRDAGKTWRALNAGLEVVEGFDPNVDNFHDPHCVGLHPQMPDRLYQQNHCGIYRIDRPAEKWERIGKTMPKSIGDVGFPIVLHPRDPNCVWVYPMDGTSVWPRTNPGGKPAVYSTRNGGKTWKRHDAGLPKPAWFTVFRQALAADTRDPVGIYFGTTTGEIFGSRDEGKKWFNVASHLPDIYAVEAAELRK
jgi:hypothetical protein